VIDEVVLTQSVFVDRDSVGFAVAYIKDRDTIPVVGLATVDFGTDDEDRVELGVGQPFQIAGQTWQITEIRNPTDPDWAVVLRRIINIADGAPTRQD
jgi:hypothetical protein